MLFTRGDRHSWLHKLCCNFLIVLIHSSSSASNVLSNSSHHTLLCISVYSSVVSSSLNEGQWQSDVSRKLDPVISCRSAASIILWHCCILLLHGLMWVGRQTAGEGKLWKSVFQGHLFVKLGAGARSELPVSRAPERDNSAVLCVLQMSEDAARPILMATSSCFYNHPQTLLITPYICLCDF